MPLGYHGTWGGDPLMQKKKGGGNNLSRMQVLQMMKFDLVANNFQSGDLFKRPAGM